MINKLIIILLFTLISSCASNRDIVIEDRANIDSQVQKSKQLEQEKLAIKAKAEQDRILQNKIQKDLADKNKQYPINAKTKEGFIDIDNQVDSEPLFIINKKEQDLLLQKNKQRTTKAQANNNGLPLIFYFGYDSVNLDEKTIIAVTAHAQIMQKNKTLKLRLEGHTDERGSRSYNLALGENRALAIKDVMALYDVQDRIEVVSYGEEKPKNDQHNANAWKQNRRVELIFY